MARLLRTCLAVAVVCAGTVSRAAPKDEAPERRAAAAEFRRGKQLYAAKEYAQALEAFVHGYELSPLRGFLVNIGQCQRRLGQLREAAESYEKYLQAPGGPAALRAEVEEALAEVREAERVAQRATPARPTPTEPPVAPVETKAPDVAEPAAVALTAPAPVRTRRRWVVPVAVTTSLLVVGGVAIGAYFGYRTTHPAGGSLGLVDGRSP